MIGAVAPDPSDPLAGLTLSHGPPLVVKTVADQLTAAVPLLASVKGCELKLPPTGARNESAS